MALFRRKKETESVDWLIVGLGNPGAEYEQTRHNQGFRAIDILAERLKASYWKTDHEALCARIKPQPATGDAAVMLAKPQTFMNLSGRAVRGLARALNLKPEQIIIIHDELDLPADEVRIKRGGGHGGHNGLRSIIDELQTQDFIRVRIGIGRPPGHHNGADYVLERLRPAQLEEAHVAAVQAADATLAVVTTGLLAAQNLYHRAHETIDP